MFAPFFSYIATNKYIIGAVLLVTVFTSAYIYYLRTSSKIEKLEHDNQILQLENDSLKQAIVQIQKDYQAIIEAKESLSERTAELEKQTKNIKDTLYRENQKKKSLEELAIKKTSLIQKKVNDATGKVLECFETLSKGGDC